MTEVRSESAQDGSVGLALPPEDVSVAVARSVVRRIVTFRDDDAESSLLVALTEIVSNAIEEHQRLGLIEPVTITVHLGEYERVEVCDAGAGLDHDAVADGAPDPTAERGRGLALARAFVPNLRLSADESGTTAVLPLRGFGVAR